MKNRLLAILLTATMVVTMAVGCTKKAETTEGTQQTTETAEDTTVEENTETASAEVKEITVWAWDKGFNGTAMEEADKLYEGATINFVEMSKADCLQKIHTVLASGVTDDLPDVVLIGDLAAQGYLMSYPDAFMPMDDVINYDDFASYKKASVSYDNVGYTQEDMQDLTWDEYFALGEKLKEKGHLLQTYNPNDIAEFQIMLQSAGTWFTDDEGKANFTDNAALKEGFEIFDKFNKSDIVKIASDWTEFAGAINGGDVACVIRGS